MERIFLNNNFHYVTVVPVSNGVGWTTAAIAQQITTFYRARNFVGDGIVVWIDREKRAETAEQIQETILQALIAAGAPEEDIHVLIADRMSENVILADEYLMREELDDDSYTYDFEGLHGKHRLTELLKNVGKSYKETSAGVALLKRVRLAECAATSPSVARLLSTLQFPCWWLEARN